MDWTRVLGFVLRPLFIVLLFGTALWIGSGIRRRLPEGCMKPRAGFYLGGLAQAHVDRRDPTE
jgi:hypothetical protein